MPTDVIMPQMGESIFEGTITKWFKKPGDAVQKDEPLFEISTDKVDAEIPSPVDGVLSEIRFAEGATVQVNEVVAVLDAPGAAAKKNGPAPAEEAKTAKNPPAATQPPSAPETPSTSGQPVVMPQMGESIFEGTIVKWLKKVGDTVRKDEPLFEISTDKVDAEIPSPSDGVLTEIKAEEGVTVQVNAVVAVIGGTASASEVPAATPPPASPVAKAEQPEPQPAQPAPIHREGKLRSSPLVRRIAKEHAVDLGFVQGTGSEGRITKDDILGYIKSPGAAKSVASPTSAAAPLTSHSEPLSKMRAIIAQRMSESKRTIPHAHLVYKVDMTRIARLRDRERDAFEKRNGIKLTYMPFIAAATTNALRKFPILNASLDGNNIQYHGNINLGIAVALEWGLIVPVIRQAETQSFVAIAQAINDLAGRARTKKLTPDEVGGSTFTVTNAGVFGGEFGTPVINPPEAAILAIGGLRKEPVVLTDADGNDTIAIRSMQYFCLGFDHRLIDGADAGRFMTELKNVLEGWSQPIG